MNAYWEIQKIIENPNTRLVIDYRGEGEKQYHITGYVTQDTTSMSTSANYSGIGEIFQSAAEAAMGPIKSFIEKKIGETATAVASGILSHGWDIWKAVAGMGNTVAGSVKKWDGSCFELPTLQLLFVAINPDDRPQDKAAQLMSCALPGAPIMHDNTSNKDLFFWSPNKYRPLNVLGSALGETGLGYSNVGGTCWIKIGDWFEMPGCILTNCSFDFSKETTRAGNPLYVTGMANFTSYRDIKASEFRQFFKGLIDV